jgi:uroporphyrinogen-III synthase
MTVRGMRDLDEADVVLYDDLIGLARVFGASDGGGKWRRVGKRCGAHSMGQDEISRLICDEARKGRRVVRLKGGDAGLFGRLAEETAALDALEIPYLVRPGVSALVAATTPNGLSLTKRGEARGFGVFTPRSTGAKTPQVFFMASKVADEVLKKFPKDERYAMVYDACGPYERIETGVCGKPELPETAEPGILVVGFAGGPRTRRRVLLTCSAAVMPRAVCAAEDRGWRAVEWPMIELRARDRLRELDVSGFDAVVLTSPSAVRIFFENTACDRRRLPEFWTCGAGTDAELRKYGIASDLMPESDFSAQGLIETACARLTACGGGRRILRLRSTKAGDEVAEALRAAGAEVEDEVLYDNVPVVRDAAKERLPDFDTVFFASASAVEAFLAEYGAETLTGRRVLVIGKPTREALPAELGASAEEFAWF